MSGWHVDGVGGFNASIDALIEAVNGATRSAAAKGAALIEANAKASFGPAHSKGSPKTVFDKPQSITGTLRRSIQMIGVPIEISRGVWQSRVAPTTIYGRRIELGFHGVDSLGRNYSSPGQPSYPYMKPGVEKSIPSLNAVFEAAWAEAMKV